MRWLFCCTQKVSLATQRTFTLPHKSKTNENTLDLCVYPDQARRRNISDNASRLLTCVSQPLNDRLSGRVLWYEQTLQKRRCAKIGGTEPFVCMSNPFSRQSAAWRRPSKPSVLCCLQMLHRRKIPLHVCVPAVPAAETAVVWSVTLCAVGASLPVRSCFRSHFHSSCIFMIYFHFEQDAMPAQRKKQGIQKSRRCFSRRSNPNCIQRWLCLRNILFLMNCQENRKMFFQIKIFRGQQKSAQPKPRTEKRMTSNAATHLFTSHIGAKIRGCIFTNVKCT